jgi:hypothetical protein
MLSAYLAFVTRRRDAYISFLRGAAGGDNFVVEVYDETRAALTARVLQMLGEPDEADRSGSATRMTVHAWFAYVEDLAVEWSALGGADQPMTATELVEQCLAALDVLRRLGDRHALETGAAIPSP